MTINGREMVKCVKMIFFFAAIFAGASMFATSATPLRTIADALAMTASDGLGPWPFDLTGQVYTASGTIRDFKDATGGYPFEDHCTNSRPPALGDIVRIRGNLLIAPDDLHHFQVACLDNLGNAPLPPPISLSDADLDDPHSAYSFARIRGVVTAILRDDLDAHYRLLILRTQHRSIDVAVSCSIIPPEQLRQLLDAETEITGLFTRKAGLRRNLGMHMILNSADDLKILSPPGDPFACPELHDDNSPHRNRVAGRVIAASDKKFFLSTKTGRFLEIHVGEDCSVPLPDTCVEASGFVDSAPFLLRLTEAVVRSTAEQIPPLPPPQEVEFDRLFSHTNEIGCVNTAKHGRLIRLKGTVSDLLDGTAPATFFIKHHHWSVLIDMTGLQPSPTLPTPDSSVEITGLCLAEFENDRAHRTIPRFRRFVLIPRSSADIRIISRPSWWTPLRLSLVIIGLTIALVAVSIWNRSLRILSERRGRQLYREELGHVLAEKKTEERTRLAVELHDSISQTLTGVAMQVDAACRADQSGLGAAKPYLNTAKTLLSSCRHELRCCIWDLQSRTFEEKNLREAILHTLHPHLGDIDLAVRFNVPCRLLSESTIHTILRIIRELSVNALRHGKATRLRIAGERLANSIRFSVQDNGCGFEQDPATAAKAGHFGLQGIRERLKGYNGRLELESSPGGGIKATVTLVAPELEESA